MPSPEWTPENGRTMRGRCPVKAHFILSCMDRDEAFAVPYSWIAANKKNMNVTDRGERSYWHVPVTTLDDRTLAINTSKIGSKTTLKPYRFVLPPSK